MRTTLTLDRDVDAKLRAEARRSGKPLKLIVNDCLRVGLNSRLQKSPAKPFVIKARTLGLKPGYSYDNIEELLDQIEGPLRR